MLAGAGAVDQSPAKRGAGRGLMRRPPHCCRSLHAPTRFRAGRGRWLALLCVLFLGVATLARAADPPSTLAEPVVVRSGNHPDFGRVVFDTPAHTTFHVTRDGDRLTVSFPASIALSTPPAAPRNVVSVHSGGTQAELVIAPRATFRTDRIGPRIVVDVFDPVPDGAAAAPPSPVKPPDQPAHAKPLDAALARVQQALHPPPQSRAPPDHAATAEAAGKPPPAMVPRTPAAAPALVPAPVPAPAMAQPAPPAAETHAAAPAPPIAPADTVPAPANGPVALLARRAAPPAGTSGTGFAVPFPNTVGAALFRHGGSAFVVFDERRPVDLTALRTDPVFGSASVQMLPSGTLIRLLPPAGLSPSLLQSPKGWTVVLLPNRPHQSAIAPEITSDHVVFPAEQPSDVVAVADPDSGATWLVGTQHQSGQGVATAHRTGEFALLPTSMGVVVEPFADSIALRVAPTGFELTGAQGGLAVSPQPAMADVLSAAARLTRRFDFSPMPTESLAQQLTRLVNAAAIAPAQARGPKRRAAATTMIALGLTAEAQSLLQLAAEADPNEAASPDNAGLKAIAALMAGRPEEAGALSDPRLNGTDDIALWRAIRQAMTDEGSAEAASTFAATAPLAFAAPPAIRDRILPLVMETMVLGGQATPAAKLLAQRPDDPQLGYARALLAQANGDTEAALHLYDMLANNHDQLNRARAAWRAVELRLASGKIDTKQAADALDKLLYAWRGDQRDLALRVRLADLRAQSGGWRAALSLLREAEVDFPDHATDIANRLRVTFSTLLSNDEADKLPPLDLIALMDENADLLPTTPEGDAMKLRLADKLLALDLPKRAEPLLDKLMQEAPAGSARAGLGARLARLRLHEGDIDGALTALGKSSTEELPPPLFETRALLAASAYSQKGDTKAAIAALSPLTSAAADEQRATVAEQAEDWPGAERALTAYVAKVVPETGDLDDSHRRALLRLATAAARAGDAEALAALRTREEGRIGTGPMADMFRLLTADPVRGTGDLARAKREVGLARALPEGLKAFQPATATR